VAILDHLKKKMNECQGGCSSVMGGAEKNKKRKEALVGLWIGPGWTGLTREPRVGSGEIFKDGETLFSSFYKNLSLSSSF